MTALSVVQWVADRVSLPTPSVVFSSTDANVVKLRNLLLEAVDYVREDGNWQALSTQATITGDGSATSFDLPSDYDFIPREGALWGNSLTCPLPQIHSQSEWLGYEVRGVETAPNRWIIYGDQIHIKEALGSGELVKYFYQSKNAVVAADTSTKEAPTADTDTFKLSERLLQLCMVWMYRRDEAMPYDGQMEDYERAKGKAVTRDGGPAVLRIGAARMPRNVIFAYPKAVT